MTAYGQSARIVMHVDFDYFFAQCEEVRRQEIKDRPVVVCVFSGRTEDSGVVSTANYVARKHGVKSGIPINVAKANLAGTEALFLPRDMEYYSQVSKAAMTTIMSQADVFEHIGIDECYMDISSKTGLDFVAAEDIARHVQGRVRTKTQLTCSIGVAPNKMLAKIASDFHKPDGLTVIRPEEAAEFVSTLDVERIPGIGPKTRDRLAELGITNGGQLAQFDLFKLIEVFGRKAASYMHNAAYGVDEEPVIESDSQRKQVMRIMTLKKDSSEASEMYSELEEICRSVHKITTEDNRSFRSIGIILILSNLENVSRSKSLKTHSSSIGLLHSTTRALLDETLEKKIIVRRLGVRLLDFQDVVGQNTLNDFMK